MSQAAEEVRSTLSWKQKLKARWDSIWARCVANPLLIITLGVAIASLVSLFGISITSKVREHGISAPLMAVPEGTLYQVNQALDKNQLKSITKHTVYKNRPWNDVELTRISIFELKNGTKLRLGTDVLPEEFWKNITKASEKQAFKLSEGEEFPRPSTLMSIAGTMLLYSTLILVLLAAQMMVGQVVSGHTFQADQRDLNVRMDDIIGYPEVKQEVHEIMDQIRNAPIYAQKGVKAPRGLLLLGDPGVGKTMLAKAMANEMKAKFFYCTGADFAEMYVGVGARRVRALFKRARKYPRSFIFIDEIDAIGTRNTMGNDSERQSVINALLAEMDGINANGALLVMGATNHAQMLDPALRRAGRFDKQIHIPLPDFDTRKGILGKYLSGLTVGEDIDLDALAHRTTGYSGAALAGLVAEAKNLALRESPTKNLVLTQSMLERAQEVVMLGVSTQKAHPDDLDRVAVHELGHALGGFLYCPDVFVEKVTLVGRGHALGYTLMRPQREVRLHTQKAMYGNLIMKLAGRAAEEVILGQVSSGAADDLEKATETAREMVAHLGMGSRTGLMVPARSHDPGSIPQNVQDDMRDLLERAYTDAKTMVQTHQNWIQTHRHALQERDVLTHETLRQGLDLSTA